MAKHTDNNGTTEQDKTRVQTPPPIRIVPENLVQILWRSRWIALATIALALAAGLIYVTAATPMYTSTARIYVEQSGPKILAEAEGVTAQPKNFLYTQAELLKSTPILSAALEETGMGLKIFDGIDNPITYLQKKGLTVSVGKTDDIIDVSCDSADAVEAAQLVTAVVNSYISYHEARKRSTAAEVLRILQKEKRERDLELAQKLKTMMDFKSQNIALAFENRNSNVVLDRLGSLSAELTRAEIETVGAKSVYENAKSMMADPARLKQFAEGERAKGLYVSAANEWSRLDAELDQLQLQLTDLRQQATPDQPGTDALAKKVAQVESRLVFVYRKFAETQLAIAEQQYKTAKEKQEQIAGSLEAQRLEALELNKQLAQYRILESDWEQTKKLCDILDDRIKQIDITEDVGSLNIDVLEAALPADEPSWPPKARYMAIALLLGLVLAGVAALVHDWMDQRLHSAEEIADVLGVPIVGMVPSMSRKESVAARGQKVHLDSKSLWAETYRMVRTAVFFAASQAKGRTILVTSPEVADGKTTVVSNLAIAMAQAGQKTLILEADFRRPMQHKVFGLNHHDRGLSSVLGNTEDLDKVIQPTYVQGLDLLACGPEVPDPSETLHSENFAKLMKLLAKKYDRVIVDSPPVLPVTDAQILASICQITLLVLRAEKSTRKASRQAHDALVRVGAHVLGVVVNDVPKNGRYGYHGGYGYYRRSCEHGPYTNGRNADREKPVVAAAASETVVGSNDSQLQGIANDHSCERRQD